MSDEMQQDVAFEQTEEQEDNGMAEQPEQTEDAQQTTEDAVEAVEATDADAEAVDAEGDDNDMEEIDDDTEDDRKLFVGGISWESTVKDLREHFEKFGKVVHCTLKTDYVSHKSRGFGFVSFASPESVEKVLNAKEPHKLHGRVIDPKKAEPRPKKIFVGKLDPDTPQEDVSAYFSKFGEVEKMEFPFDKTKEKRRAFCFVEFKKMSAFKKCLEDTTHKIKTQEVDVKKATLQQSNSGMRGGQRGRGFGPNSRGGRGGGFQGQYGYNQNNYYPTYYDPNAGFYDQQGYYNDGSYYGNNYYSGWNGGGGYQGYGNNNYYGYEDWGNGQGGGNNSNFGKSQKRGGSQAFHPYNR